MRLKPLLFSFLSWCQTARPARPLQWRVFANDVHVGSLPDGELRAIRRAVVCNWRNYVRQTAYGIQFAMHLASQLVYYTPVAWFWLLAASSFMDQAGMSEFFARAVVEPSAFADALVKSISFAFGISAAAVALRLAVESIFCRQLANFPNAFVEDWNRRLRLRFNLVAGADFVLLGEHAGEMAPATASARAAHMEAGGSLRPVDAAGTAKTEG